VETIKEKPIRFQDFSDLKIIKIITENSYVEICKKYNIDKSKLSLLITKRNLFEVKSMNRLRRVESCNELPPKVVYSEGSWMKSKERYSYANAGLISNKSIKYENIIK